MIEADTDFSTFIREYYDSRKKNSFVELSSEL